MGWGVFSLLGRASKGDPIAANAGNFLRCVPLAVALVAVAAWQSPLHATPRGIALAVASGSVASGCGYSLWYAALRRLSATRAAIVQTTVPILAAVGGVLFIGETISSRLSVAAAVVVGGTACALARLERREL